MRESSTEEYGGARSSMASNARNGVSAFRLAVIAPSGENAAWEKKLFAWEENFSTLEENFSALELNRSASPVEEIGQE